MPNPRRTTGQRRRRRHEHVATPEIQKKARQGAKSAAKTVTRAASKVVKATAPSQPSSRGTQTYTQPRNARNRATTPTTNKPAQNKPIQRQVTKPKTPTAQVQKPKLQQTKPTVSYTPKYTPTVTKFGTTNAKEQYQEFKTKYKTVAERKAEREADKKKTWKEKQKEYQKAYQKGKDLTYLGTKQEKTKTSLNGNKTINSTATKLAGITKAAADTAGYFASDQYKSDKKAVRKQTKKDSINYLKSLGLSESDARAYLSSGEGKAVLKDITKDNIKYLNKTAISEYQKDAQKQTKKKIKKINSKSNTLESVNALTRGEFNRMTEASRINNKKLGNLQLKGGKGRGKDIREKVGSKTAESALKGKFATGAMQGLSYVDVFNGVGTYNKAAKKAIKKTKGSGAYLAGYGVGMAGQFALGGTNALGKSIAKTGGKAAAKTAGKKFIRNRAGELVAETPTNIVDAAKMSMDENGKINKKEFAKWAAINTGFTGGMGGAMEGIGGAITKKQASNMKKLLAKQQAKTITEEETKQLDKIVNKLGNKAKNKESISSNIAEKGLEGRRKSLTTSANASADKVTEQARKAFETTTENRRAKVAAQKEYDKKAVHLENNVKQAKKTRDALKESVDDLKALRKKDGTMAGHQQIVDRYGSVEKLDAVISRTESALKTSRKRLREVQTNFGTEKKRLQRTNAKIDKEFPVEAKEVKGETKAPESVIKETKPVTKETDKAAELKKRYKAAGLDDTVSQRTPAENKALIRSWEETLPRVENEVADAQKKQKAAFAKGNNAEGRKWAKIYSDRKVALSQLQDNIAEFKKADKIADDYAKEIGEVDRAAFVQEQRKGFSTEKNRRLDGIQRQADEIKEDIKTVENRIKGFDSDITSGKFKDNPKALAALKRRKTIEEAKLEKLNSDLADTRKSWEELYNGTGKGGFRSVDEDDVTIKGEVKAGNRTVAQDSKDVAATVNKTTKEAEPPKAMPKKGDPEFKTKGLIYKVRRALFNDLAAIDDIGSGLSKDKKDSFHAQTNAMRMARSTASSKVAEGLELFNKYGLTKKANKQKLNDFQEYAWLKHDLEIFNNDPSKEFLGFHSVGNNIEESRAAIENRIAELSGQYGKDIDEFQEGLVKYFNDLLDMEVDAGLSTKEFAQGLKSKYKNYVPKFVAKEFDENVTKTFKDELDIASGMREAKGGKAEEGLVPLYEQMVAKTNAVYKRTELNRTAKAMAEAWGINPNELETVKLAAKATDEDMAESIMDCAVFTPKPKNGQYKIWYYVNGDKHELPVSKEIIDEIRNWTGEQKMMMFEGSLGKVLDNVNDKLIAPVARLWKDFITDYSLIFGVKNHARDIETALFYTKDLKGYMRNLPKAYAAMFSRNEDSILKMMKDAYRKNGGVYSQLVTSGKFDTNFYKSAFQQAGKVNPLRPIKEFNSAMESIPRLAEFMSAMDSNVLKRTGKRSLDELTTEQYEKALRECLNDHDAIADAMYRAKDVTLNFDRGGWLGKKLNRGIVPFFNPSVQGLSKLARELTSSNIVRDEAGNIQMLGKKIGKDGKEVNTLRGATAAAFGIELGKVAGLVAAPVTLLNSMFGDYYEGKVDGYGALSDYNKYTYYNFPIGDGQYIKVPRARELASMQDGIDWLFHHIKYSDGQNPDSPMFVDTKWQDLANLGKISWEQIGPVNVVEDNLFSPIARTLKGKTWYGSNIESWEDQDKIAEGKSNEVWDENTSALAKSLGNTDAMKKLGISPKKIDNALDGYFGIIYDMGISQTSAKNKVRIEAGEHGPLGGILAWGKSVAASNFMIDSVFQNRYKADNYIRQGELNKEIEKLEKEGKTNTHEWNEAKAKLNKIKNAYSYNSIQFDETSARIYLDNTLSAADKKKATRELAESQTKMWQSQAKGSVTSPVDPLAVVYRMRDSKGNRILPIRSMLEACSYTSKDDTNNILDAYDAYREKGGKSGKFMRVTLASRDVNRAAGASTSFCNWRTNAFAVVLNDIKDAKGVLEAYGDKNVDYTLRDAQHYKSYDGTIKTYKKSSKDVTQGAYDIGLDYASQMEQWDVANSLSNKQHIDREYFAQGKYSKVLKGNDALIIMNAARCLSSDKYKKNWHNDPKEEISRFCRENEFTYKDKQQPDPEKVAKAIQKTYGKKCTKEECAAVFWEICPFADNPFGEIGDYSLKGDTGIKSLSSSGGGRRRKGHGHGGGGGRGRKTGTVKAAGNASNGTPASGTRTYKSSGKVSTKVASRKVTKHKAKSIKLKSNLDDAYRKRLKKLREEQRKEIAKAHK